MPNEVLLIISLIVIYSLVVLAYKFLGKTGLYCWTVIATIAANIEVLIVVDAFGMEMTLGNILFASTFLVTDILSEKEGKKESQKAVIIGIAASVVFVIISQSWLLYTPNENDWVSPSISAIFKNTPRLMFASLVVYAFVQMFDVFLYHKIWDWTNRICKDNSKFLWLRNNGATMISQLLNTVLYTFAAFYGVYDMKTLLNIVISTFVIYMVTSLLDTPAVYVARKISVNKERNNI